MLGRASYASLVRSAASQSRSSIFFARRRPCPAIVDEAIAVGREGGLDATRRDSRRGRRAARAAGLEVVMDRCMKIEHARFFGGLNTVGLKPRANLLAPAGASQPEVSDA